MADKKDIYQAEHADSNSEERGSQNGSDFNLNDNIDARIKNPLAHLSHDALMRDVDEFAREYSLDHVIPLLRKGALVAQNPAAFESVEGIDETEIAALRDEVLHKWRQPRALYFTVILCSIGAAVQGWDQTGSNGANLSFPIEFGIPDDPENVNYARNLWLVGLVNAGEWCRSLPSHG